MTNEATNLQHIIQWLCDIGYDRSCMTLEVYVPDTGKIDLFYQQKGRIQFILEAKRPGVGENISQDQAIRYAHGLSKIYPLWKYESEMICIATDYSTYLKTWHCGFKCELQDGEDAPINWRTRHLLRVENFRIFRRYGTLALSPGYVRMSDVVDHVTGASGAIPRDDAEKGVIATQYLHLHLKDPTHMPHVMYAMRARVFQETLNSAGADGLEILAMQIPAPTPKRIAHARTVFKKIEAANAEVARQKKILEELEHEMAEQPTP